MEAVRTYGGFQSRKIGSAGVVLAIGAAFWLGIASGYVVRGAESAPAQALPAVGQTVFTGAGDSYRAVRGGLQTGTDASPATATPDAQTRPGGPRI